MMRLVPQEVREGVEEAFLQSIAAQLEIALSLFLLLLLVIVVTVLATPHLLLTDAHGA